MSRKDLCTVLVNNHNYGKNPRQEQTNRNHLGVLITQSACVNALTYTTGYNSLAGRSGMVITKENDIAKEKHLLMVLSGIHLTPKVRFTLYNQLGLIHSGARSTVNIVI